MGAKQNEKGVYPVHEPGHPEEWKAGPQSLHITLITWNSRRVLFWLLGGYHERNKEGARSIDQMDTHTL